ncbi:MAG TPA: PorP/SprF family type IX secretion system membrane protein, partial [Haliscomenobacter sp.]|nr:PorP/SprF family type IX secretion system membrane protein [Haliscomenobacter sp.]
AYRRNWLNVNDAPQTQILNFEMVWEDRSSVFGAHIINDKTGKLGQTGFYGNYAYILDMGGRTDRALVIGLGAGLVQYGAKLSEIDFPDISNRPSIDDNLLFPDFSLGAFFYEEDRYYLGVSIPQVFGLDTRFTAENGRYDVKRLPHVYGVGGYYFDSFLGNSTSFLEVSSWLRYVPNAPLSIDVNGRLQISELYWAGIGLGGAIGQQKSMSVRAETGFVFGEQVRIENGQFKLGIAYDQPLISPLGRYFGGAFEVHLLYSWWK